MLYLLHLVRVEHFYVSSFNVVRSVFLVRTLFTYASCFCNCCSRRCKKYSEIGI